MVGRCCHRPLERRLGDVLVEVGEGGDGSERVVEDDDVAGQDVLGAQVAEAGGGGGVLLALREEPLSAVTNDELLQLLQVTSI